MSARAVAFDHAVITVGERMDEAVETFRRLGFFVTPRGHHTLGSINHLVVLGSTYIELLGLPAGAGDARPELRDAPVGLSGLVIRSDDADATHAAATARGAPVQAVQRFSRPVQTDGVTRDAVFRTVRTVPGASSAGRVYFCEHLTPELVWHQPWQRHANGALDLCAASVRVTDLEAECALWRALVGDDAIARSVPADRSVERAIGSGAIERGDADARAAAAGFSVRADPVTIGVERARGDPGMTSLSVRVADLDRAARALAAGGVAYQPQGGGLRVAPADAFNLEMRFVTGACQR